MPVDRFGVGVGDEATKHRVLVEGSQDVEDHAALRRADDAHRAVEQRAVVPAQRLERVAPDVRAVDPHERGGLRVDLTLHEREVLQIVHPIPEHVSRHGSHRVGVDGGARHAVDLALGPQTPRDQVGDGQDPQLMLARERLELGEPGHGPVRVHDLADHARSGAAGEPGEVDGPLGLTRAHEDPTVAGPQRENVSGGDEVGGRRVGLDRHRDRSGAVRRGDPGGDAGRRLDRDREGSPVGRVVLAHHHRQVELLDPVRRERQADETAPVGGHEVDRHGRGEVRGHDEVALVLAGLVIDEDDHLAGGDVVDRGLHTTLCVFRERLEGRHH